MPTGYIKLNELFDHKLIKETINFIREESDKIHYIEKLTIWERIKNIIRE